VPCTREWYYKLLVLKIPAVPEVRNEEKTFSILSPGDTFPRREPTDSGAGWLPALVIR
jgi:hypothetical protein